MQVTSASNEETCKWLEANSANAIVQEKGELKNNTYTGKSVNANFLDYSQSLMEV